MTDAVPRPGFRPALLAGLLQVLSIGLPALLALPVSAAPAAEQADVRALNDKGVYWYERLRLDLAGQAFNRILLLDPTNASALRWQGLINLANGDIQAASVWLAKLRSVDGQTALSTELQQAISLASEKRQQLAELRYLAASEKVPADLPQRLLKLLPQPPVGEAAIQVYRLMNGTAQGNRLARAEVSKLARRFPEDRRYRNLLAELGGSELQASATENRPESRPGKQANTRTITPAAGPATALETAPALVIGPAGADAQAATPSDPVLSAFEQGQALASKAQQEIDNRNTAQAALLLRQAVDLNPAYPWFRYDLAVLLDEQGDPAGKQAARGLLDEGLALDQGQDMRFAAALLAARQSRNSEALELIQAVPRERWTQGMSALEKRVQYGQYLGSLRLSEQSGNLNNLAGQIAANPTWRAEPEVQELAQNLARKRQARLAMSYENALIDGDAGVSRISSSEIPLQLDLPLDFEHMLFIRADSLTANAGRVDANTATNFAKLGTTPVGNPAVSSTLLDQNYRGHVIGLGLQAQDYRLDIGTTTGDYPVNDWVGGLQWRTDLGAGSLRLELARRMVNGSVLSTTGAIDPLTGESWGGARRNGVSAVYYQAFNPTLDFVGIARGNLITGRNIPDNREINLQGILGKTVYQSPGQEVELGASLFLWSFEKNLRFYTFGQAGYYSPQAFGSLTFPVTWTGQKHGWSWLAQARLGASESREDDTELYPLNPDLALAAAAQGNPTLQTGGPGGGVSTGFRLALEKKLLNNLVLGGYMDIDRSEGYNPDRFQLYLKYSFGDFFELAIPPEGVGAYSRF